MAGFINAEPGMKHSVIYTDGAGQYVRYSGGTGAWRSQKSHMGTPLLMK